MDDSKLLQEEDRDVRNKIKSEMERCAATRDENGLRKALRAAEALRSAKLFTDEEIGQARDELWNIIGVYVFYIFVYLAFMFFKVMYVIFLLGRKLGMPGWVVDEYVCMYVRMYVRV